jgi:hypothetical protein
MGGAQFVSDSERRRGVTKAFRRPQFLAIDEARRVFDLIQRAARKDNQ